MLSDTVLARKHLEARIGSLRDSGINARPPRGWIRALRDALGITAAQLGQRLGVSQSQATHLEQGEMDDSITLRSLRAAAEVLECELVYALVPRQPLDELLQGHAKRVAEQRLARTSHTMALENQALTKADLATERDRLVAELLTDPRRIWRAE